MTITTDIIHIDGNRVLNLLNKAVEEYGADYVDPGAEMHSCNNVYRNVDTSEVKHCIAAKVLSLAGITDEELLRAGGGIESTIDSLVSLGVQLDVSSEARVALAVAQSVQDMAGTWNIANQAAHRAVQAIRNTPHPGVN